MLSLPPTIGSYEIVKLPQNPEDVGYGESIIVNLEQQIPNIEAARHCATFEWFLIKVDDEKSTLSEEASILHSASGGVGIPRLRYFGIHKGRSVMILDLYGPCLEQVFNHRDRQCSMQTLLLLAIQLLSRVRYLHSRNILHGNLSPWSFALGCPNWQSHQFMFTDFKIMKDQPRSARGDLLRLGNILSYMNRGASTSWEDHLIRPPKTEPPFLASYFRVVEKSQKIDYQLLQSTLQGYYEEFVCQMEVALGLGGSRALKQSLTPNLGHLLTCSTGEMRQHHSFALERVQCGSNFPGNGDLFWHDLDHLFEIYIAIFVRYKAEDISRALNDAWGTMHSLLHGTSQPLRLSILYRFYRFFAVLLETLPSYKSNWISCLSNIAMLLSNAHARRVNIDSALQTVAHWKSVQDEEC